MMEIWKDIPGFTGYKISNTGKVMSYKNKNKPILLKQSQSLDNNPRLKVKLSENGISKRYFVHRLMMLTFYPREDSNTLEVNHIDGNGQNNILENLEWVTPKENFEHYKNVLIPERQKNGTFIVGKKPNNIEITFSNGVKNYYKGMKEITEDLNIKHGTFTRWKDNPPSEIKEIKIIDKLPENYKNTKVKVEKRSVPRAIKISFYGEKEPLIFDNCREADKYFNLSKGTIRRWWENIDKEKKPNKLKELKIKYIEKI